MWKQAFSLLAATIASLLFLSACQPKEEQIDTAELKELATRYAAAWSSQDPEAFGAFYAENGSLQINDGEPSIGRAAVTETARGFMTAFPDMVVRLQELREANGYVEFHWQWTGTNTGPGGTGNAVDLHGYEQWTLDDDGLILESLGHLDDAEYQRQLHAGLATNRSELKPKVAVIGTGDMGDSLGPRLAAAGYSIVYGSRDPDRDSVHELVRQTGGDAAATTQKNAAQSADIVLLVVPWPAMEKVARNLGDLSGKTVVDASFPFRQAADGYIESMVETSSAEMIQSWNKHAHVVKVGFPASNLIDDPSILGEPPPGVLIAADNREAKEKVAELVADLGLEAFDAGPLRHSRNIEAMGNLYMVPLLQGREDGWEYVLRRNSYWQCTGDPTEWYETPVFDEGDLAKMPEPKDPAASCFDLGL